MGINKQYPIKAVLSSLSEFIRLRLIAQSTTEVASEARKGGKEEEEGEEEEEEEDEEWGTTGRLPSLPPGQRYNGTRRVRISFEYLLLNAINDSRAQAEELVRLLNDWEKPFATTYAHINLIPFNDWEGAPEGFAAPSPESVEAFAAILRREGFSTTVRRARGAEVGGACGMLKVAKKNLRRVSKQVPLS